MKKLSIQVSLQVHITCLIILLTEDRVRHAGNIKAKFKVLRDFYFNLTSYESFDSDPPGTSASNDDFGIITSFSYSF